MARRLTWVSVACAAALHAPHAGVTPRGLPGRAAAAAPRMALSLDPEKLSDLDDGPAASQGPFGKGGQLEWVANILDKVAEDTLAALHAFDDDAVKDSSKNLQVLWSRAVLAHLGELDDPIAYQLLPESTRGVVDMGLFDGVGSFLEWVAARTAFLNEGTDAFLSSPACAGGKPCQVVVLGAGFDTRSIRYQREGLRFFEVDLPDTIEAKRVVHERYKAEVNPECRLPTRVGWDLNDCATDSLLDHLEANYGFARDQPTLFISEAVMFYVKPLAIAKLYDDIFQFGQKTEAMYCFTDSMRPFVQGPFSDECTTFFDREGITLLSHTARWSGAVQFAHAVARTADAPEASLLSHVADLVEPPVNSYAPERSVPPEGATAPTYNNSWYAVAYSSELTTSTPYSTRLFNEPLTLERTGEASVTTASALDSSVRYVTADHQGLVYVWRGAAEEADERMLPTHPTPEQTHTVETILDYGCDWKYIVENNLDTPHLYWLHDGSIPPIESLGCNRDNIGSIGLRAFRDDIGTGHIGKTSKKVTKVVRYDAPNIVRHGGVSGFSEEFNIVPIGPHRTRVLLRQRFPKGPVLSALLNVPGVEWGLEYLVREWNYQIGLEDYCVMQGQAHLIDDLGSPNWGFTGMGDDLIIKFWKWCRAASVRDGRASEYEARWDGSEVPAAEVAKVLPVPLAEATHGWGRLAEKQHMRPHYMDSAPVADYPPLNHKGYRAPFEPDSRVVEKMRQAVEDAAERATKLGGSALLGAGLGASVGLTVAASVAFAESFPAL